MDKATFLARIHDARRRIDAAIGRVPDARMNEIALYDSWTMKDFLAHLVVWERIAMDVIDALSHGRVPKYRLNTVPVDQLNAEAYAANKNPMLADIRAESAASYAALIRMIEDASDAMLFDPQYWPYLQGYALKELIASNSSEHYDEHLGDVLAFLERVGL